MSNLKDLKCFYHPDKLATDKCGDCGKPICLECSRKYKSQHAGIGESSNSQLQRTLCVTCYSYKEESKAPFKIIVYLSIFASLILAILIFIIGLLYFGEIEPYFDSITTDSNMILDITKLLMIALWIIICFIGPIIFIFVIIYKIPKINKMIEKKHNERKSVVL